MWGQNPKLALSEAEGAVRRAKPGCNDLSPRLLWFACRRNLYQRMHRFLMFLQQPKRLVVAIAGKQRMLHCRQKSTERTESRIHRRRFVPAVHHAIGAGRIARLSSVVAPVRSREQLLESF